MWRPCIANPVVRLYAIDIEKNKESTVRIGIDLGGTKPEVIALGDAGGAVVPPSSAHAA
ncbi:hypothetical protein ACNKHT_02210 [Shigella flexneri]